MVKPPKRPKRKSIHNWIMLGYKDFLMGTPFKNAPMTQAEIQQLKRNEWPVNLEQYLDGLHSAEKDKKEGLIQ